MTDNFNKGGKFRNRYLITGTLTASAPFHIGSGEMTERTGMTDKDKKPLQISAVVVDGEGRAYIPGSSIRGALRDWLRRVYGEEDREHKELDGALKKLKRNEETLSPELVAENTTCMERLFGSAFAEGKAEVWDAECVSRPDTSTNVHLSGWDKDRVTYVAKSVAIDPETGTADDKKLYNFELVPEGASFTFTVTGQNLSDEEACLLLRAIEGFSDKAESIALGAMTKRGFGRFKCVVEGVWRLDKTNLTKWREQILKDDDNTAGYDAIKRDVFRLEEKDIATLKDLVKKPPKEAPLCKTWKVTLETPLVVRSGGSFGWKNADKDKTRNRNMVFRWGSDAIQGQTDQIGDLYFSIRLENNEAKPYYHIPSSSVRGALREWAITHLLPKKWWDIEEGLKKYAKKETGYAELPSHLVPLLSLFGFTVSTGDEEIDKKYNRAARLTIKTEPFPETAALKPFVHKDSWKVAGNDYGPTNAKRHVKPRNPLDRITHAARKGGLHNFLEFSKGQTFNMTIVVEKANGNGQETFDKEIINWWKKELNYGTIRLGALSSAGRGRVSVKEVQNA
ncbi:MAG: hypothetical protein HZA14_07440 [Nitrospirae bacterium]|nr:hypothetical protein [Nitrospirota bacterium]